MRYQIRLRMFIDCILIHNMDVYKSELYAIYAYESPEGKVSWKLCSRRSINEYSYPKSPFYGAGIDIEDPALARLPEFKYYNIMNGTIFKQMTFNFKK